MSAKTKQTKNEPVMIDKRLVTAFIGQLTMMHESRPMSDYSSDIYAAVWCLEIEPNAAEMLKEFDKHRRH